MTRNAATDMTAGTRRAMRGGVVLLLALVLSVAFAPASAAATTQLETTNAQAILTTTQNSSAKTLKIARGHSKIISTNEVGSQRRWTTSNAKIVTVKPIGRYSAKITALAPGTATITTTNDVGTLTCKVKVAGLKKSRMSVDLFSTGKLTFKGNGIAKAKKWTSSDKQCVKVNKQGKLTPIATGQALVTCTDNHGTKHNCIVAVRSPKITCKISDQKYLFQKFEFTNKSGKALSLNTNALFYSSPSAKTYDNICYTSKATGEHFVNSPLIVGGKQSATFFAQTDRICKLTESKQGFIKLGFKLGKTCYQAAFSPSTGKLLACSRAKA